MKKFLVVLNIMWEHLKSILIAVLIGMAIIISLSSIIHNVLKIREIYAEDTTGYKNLVTVGKTRLNVRVEGEGEQTVVILPDFAECSPIVKYKTYSNRLSELNCKVVTIEYFGYGYSLSSKDERTNIKLAQEIKSALTSANVNGPYTFVANGTSSLYAYMYSNLYPEDLQKLVVIDGVYPSSIKDKYTEKYVDDLTTNAVITSYAELSGYARILSYINPSVFHIDQMKEMGFDKVDIKTYRKMIANRYYTGTMKREIKELKTNMQNLQSYQYPSFLTVNQVLSTGYIDEVKQLVKENKTKTNLEKYANDMITNADIQDVVTVEGKKSNLSLDNPDKVIESILN